MCGSTVRKIHGVAIRKLSEITELSGSNGVRTFGGSWNLLAGTQLVLELDVARDHPDAAYKYRGAS